MPIPADLSSVKGFLSEEEGEKLYSLALESSKKGPILELGSYCGKSTIYIGSAVKDNNSLLYAVDHHRGSEEHQVGEEYHDPDLYDAAADAVDSLPALRSNLRRFELEDSVVPIVGSSEMVGRFWKISLSMVFIDGGHSLESALADYRIWSCRLISGGYLAIHDVFEDPSLGGQAPRKIFELAQQSGLFYRETLHQTLGVLRKL